MKTVLVTGGAGFIGSNFIRYLLNKHQDIQVINLDALTYAGNLESLQDISADPRYRFVKGDICDSEHTADLFKNHDIDRVIHFAAESHVDRSIEDPMAFVRTNVTGTGVLMDAARRAWERDGKYPEGKLFLQVGTDEVYGSLGAEGSFTEDTPLSPRSPYSASKAAADMLVLAYHHTYGFPAIVTRCSNNYGPYQFPEKLIPLMIRNALTGKKLPVYGDGKNVRDWLYVEDHCRALDMAAGKGKPGQVYNIGGHNEMENIQIVRLIIDTLAELLPEGDARREYITPALITYVEDRKGHDRRYAIDPAKIGREIGWQPETSFKEGIRRTIRWYLDNGGWLDHVTSGDYAGYYEKMYGQRRQAK
jgi:dTDP-glucose 4,6-dehydratase